MLAIRKGSKKGEKAYLDRGVGIAQLRAWDMNLLQFAVVPQEIRKFIAHEPTQHIRGARQRLVIRREEDHDKQDYALW